MKMGNMREISIEECMRVSGGFGFFSDTRSYMNIPMFNADDIIIVSGRRSYDSLSEKMFSFGGMAGYDTTAFVASMDSTYDEIQQTVARILNALFDLELKTDKERQENEEKISNEFKPEDVVSTGKTGDKATWTTKDGMTWIDTNGNGKPDYQIKFDRGGNAYGNDGSGWKRL
jgi:hypothetical protein